MWYNVGMGKQPYREIRLDLITHQTLRKLAAAWDLSMLATVARLVADAWVQEQRREREQHASDPPSPVPPAP